MAPIVPHAPPRVTMPVERGVAVDPASTFVVGGTRFVALALPYRGETRVVGVVTAAYGGAAVLACSYRHDYAVVRAPEGVVPATKAECETNDTLYVLGHKPEDPVLVTTSLGYVSLGGGARAVRLRLAADPALRGAVVCNVHGEVVGLCSLTREACVVVPVGVMTWKPHPQRCHEILTQTLGAGVVVCASDDRNVPVGATHARRFDVDLDAAVEGGVPKVLGGGVAIRAVPGPPLTKTYALPFHWTTVRRGATTMVIDADRVTVVAGEPHLVGATSDDADGWTVQSVLTAPTVKLGAVTLHFSERDAPEVSGSSVEDMARAVEARRAADAGLRSELQAERARSAELAAAIESLRSLGTFARKPAPTREAYVGSAAAFDEDAWRKPAPKCAYVRAARG